MRWLVALALPAVVIVLTSSCGNAQAPRLNVAGATFIYPMMSKWAAEYNKAKGIEVNYQSIGSDSGILQMTHHTAEFGCTDRPMNDKQLQKAQEIGGEVVHIPLTMGAVVPVYNLESVKQPLCFSGPVLADIFLGKIKKWNDPALQELNPEAPLTDKEIAVVHRSDGSGNTAIWVDYLAKVSEEWKQKVGVGTTVKWPVGQGTKGAVGVHGLVKSLPGSIGYTELIYALGNNITFGLVKNGEGVPIKASMASVTAAADGALAKMPDDLRYSITNAPGKEAYPISGTVWAVLYVSQPAGKGQQVVDFIRWITHDGQKYCDDLHYATLPSGLVARLEKKLDAVKVKYRPARVLIKTA